MGYEGPAIGELLNGDALRRALTALAQGTGDKAALRKDATALIKGAFTDARARIKAGVENGTLSGLIAARALSALQDAIIQVIYDFATKHVYYAQNPTAAERVSVVATGGYAKLIAAKLPEISAVAPDLTLEGLRLVWLANSATELRD